MTAINSEDQLNYNADYLKKKKKHFIQKKKKQLFLYFTSRKYNVKLFIFASVVSRFLCRK